MHPSRALAPAPLPLRACFECSATQVSDASRGGGAQGIDPRNVAPALPPGHTVKVTQDDLPEEDKDDAGAAGSMGDFTDAIGGDDY